jgi:predicted nucleic acid-binding protein
MGIPHDATTWSRPDIRSPTDSRRLSTYQLAQRFEALTVDEPVADAWALLVSRHRAAGRKVPINDSWIAATASAHRSLIPSVHGRIQ